MIGRNELKYICSANALSVIEARLSQIAQPDVHAGANGSYTITSLYFDDYENSCYYDNEAGAPIRYKFRARYYGDDLSTLHLEKKVRKYGAGFKYSCPLTPAQLDLFFTGQTQALLYQPEPLLRELAIRSETRRMQPKIIVRYERTPFVYRAGNVRVTLDRAICAATALERFLMGDYLLRPIQRAGEELLEVKFDTVLPSVIRQAVYLDDLQQTTFSKYYLCRKSFGRSGA